MSGLVAFDRAGVFGPAITLIYNVNDYNESAVSKLTHLITENFEKLAHQKPEGRKALCASIIKSQIKGKSITPVEILGTQFFQSMQKKDVPSHIHQEVLQYMVPNLIRSAQEKLSGINTDSKEIEVLQDWMVHCLASYMTEEQILSHCQLQKSIVNQSGIKEERKKIGEELYEAALRDKRITEKDLDAIVDVARTAMSKLLELADHQALAMRFTGQYLALFSKKEDQPEELGNDVLNLLSTKFREKVFPKSDDQNVNH